MPEEPEKMYTTQEAATLLEMSDSNLRNLIRSGKARPKQRFGRGVKGYWVFTLDEIERLKLRKRNPGPEPKK